MSSSTSVLSEKATAPTNPSGSSSRFYVPALDGLRVLACLGVWVFHVAGVIPKVHGNPILYALASVGHFGVPLFFVLSAFLITRLLQMEKERTGRVDLKAYYVRRTLRIWPLYFVVSAAGLVLAHHYGMPNVRSSVVPITTFTANFAIARGKLAPTLGPLWSLSVEEQFYLVWPLVLAFVSPRALVRISWGMIAFAFVARLGVTLHTHSLGTAFALTTSHTDSFALGTLLALNYDRLRAWSRPAGGTLLALCVAAIFAINLVTPYDGPNQLAACLGYAAVPFLCAAILAISMGTKGIFLAQPRIANQGRFSYGVYMWHMLPLSYGMVVHMGLHGTLLSLPIGIVLAVVTYYGVERPFLGLKHRFERVRSKPVAQPA